MAIAFVGTSSAYAGAAATTHTISSLSIPAGSCVVVLGGFRSTTATNITVVTTTPSSSGTWGSMDRTASNAGASTEQGSPGLNYCLNTTATITAIVFAMQTSALGTVSAACTFRVLWFSGQDTAGSVQRPQSFINAASATNLDPTKVPTPPTGSLVINVNAGSIQASSLMTATANETGAAAVTWSTAMNANGAAGNFTLGAGQTSAANVTAYGSYGTTLDTSSTHRVQWTQGNTNTKWAGAVIIPVSGGGATPTTFRRQGKRVW
jgi:hypothetical protein